MRMTCWWPRRQIGKGHAGAGDELTLEARRHLFGNRGAVVRRDWYSTGAVLEPEPTALEQVVMSIVSSDVAVDLQIGLLRTICV